MIMGKILEGKSGYYSCWYNKLQFTLFLVAFLTFGIGDTITSLNMIEQKGTVGEGNLILRYIILNYGISNYIIIKIFVTFAILVLPFLIINETVFWMLNGYFVSFIIAGILGMVLNIMAMNNQIPFLSPYQAITLFMVSVLILTNIGDEIDKRVHPKIKPFFYCLLEDIALIIIKIANTSKNKE